jgi:ketosteroid isomerase-like protein
MNLRALPRHLLLILALASAALLRAADADETSAVRAADDERVAAILAADGPRLDAIFSNDLGYTHSNGKYDTKQTYLDALVSRQLVYHTYDYKERNFRLVSADIALMTARVLIKSASNGQEVVNDLSILAVFRKEAGKWRFLAWQSAKMPPAAAK